FVVRWRHAEEKDFATIAGALEELHVQRKEAPIFLGIMHHDVPIPSAQVLRGLKAAWERFFAHSERALSVIEGNSARAILLRSFNRTLILLSGHRERCSIHVSIEQALASVSYRLRTDPAKIVQHLRMREFLSPAIAPPPSKEVSAVDPRAKG